MDLWVGYAHLFVTTALACIVAFYGRKYGKTFEASKKAEIEAKDAWIAKLKGELDLLREMNSENLLKHTKAQKELLDAHIKMLEEQLHNIKTSLAAETSNTQAQQSRIGELETELKQKELEIEKARDVAFTPAWPRVGDVFSSTQIEPGKYLLSSGSKINNILAGMDSAEKAKTATQEKDQI